MILLGINCGFGNYDIATLTFANLDLDEGWHNHPRPKTGTSRRCPLWPETIEAIEHALKIRPRPKDPAHKDLVFLTRNGLPYVRLSAASVAALAEDKAENIQHQDTINTNMWAALKRLKMKRDGLSFYGLRHTFETIGGGAKDQIAVDYIMGHVTPGMGTNYRHTIDDERLLAVTNHVRQWLFGEQETK
jgi:integrase